MLASRILMVVTSHREMGPWLEELATPYEMFEQAGHEVRIASPRGGDARLDPASIVAPWLSEAGQRFLDDVAAMDKLANTLAIEAVSADEIDAIYLVGGTGTMWDFTDCAPLGALVTTLAAAGRPVAAICHGVAGFLMARNAEGGPLVSGRDLTCFTDAEETAMGMEKIVPILAETALRAQGASFTCAFPFEAHVVVDGLLLTGQNPASAGALGARLLNVLA